MSRARVRAVFFDVGGTLIHPWPSVGDIYAAVANRHGLSVTPQQMENAFRDSWAALKRPGLTVSRKGWWRELVFRALGQEHESCFEELFERFARAEAWRIYSDAEEALRVVRACGLHTGVISNWDFRLRPLLGAMGIGQMLDSMTISCEVGFEKPDGRIFHAALAAAGVKPAEGLHVGDSYEEDVRGPRAVGMRALLLDRDTKRRKNAFILQSLRDVCYSISC